MSRRRQYLEQNVTEAKLPAGAYATTKTVSPDEKAWMLVERNVATKDFTTPRRFQLIYVNRNDELCAFVRDLGPVEQDIGEFVFPLMWEYTVAEAADVAIMWREEQGLKEKLDERAEKSTLMEDFHTLQEVKQAVLNNKTVFGFGQTSATSQRNYGRIK